jgi:hypothetical protein
MNEKENDKLEQILKKAHIPEPTPKLKERIITEAKKSWNQSSQEIPWQIPVKRLAASAAAAVIIVSITNFYNEHTLKRWHFRDNRTTNKQTSDLETIPEMPYRPFVKHLISVSRRPSIPDASALRNYTERIRRILNETQQSGASNGRVPNGGRSRLFPVQSGSDYYS